MYLFKDMFTVFINFKTKNRLLFSTNLKNERKTLPEVFVLV